MYGIKLLYGIGRESKGKKESKGKREIKGKRERERDIQEHVYIHTLLHEYINEGEPNHL